MIIFEILKASLENIWVNKMRSGLTMLGLIIGISAVVLITTLGNGAKADMRNVFEDQGKGRMNINVKSSEIREVLYRDYFTEDDIIAISDMDDVNAASGEIRRWVTVNYGKESISMDLYGVGSNYDQLAGVKLANGRFFSAEDVKGRRNVLVIDEKAAMTLFGTTDCIGNIVQINTGYQSLELMIIGVNKLSDSTLMNMATGSYHQGYTPITIGVRLSAMDRYPRALVQAQEQLEVDGVGNKILGLLTRRNKESEMYGVYSWETEFSQVETSMSFLTGTISGIAAISLMVGGIGIMNIMLVSVTERTREIGIRKAIGARGQMILMQFLFEAIVLSMLGGVIGLVLGSVMAMMIVNLLGLPFILSQGAVGFAFLFSTLVGIFFGVYPAKKAAGLDPIEALRYE